MCPQSTEKRGSVCGGPRVRRSPLGGAPTLVPVAVGNAPVTYPECGDKFLALLPHLDVPVGVKNGGGVGGGYAFNWIGGPP
uniref:Uncharacterized protein n=1 Tax=Knipowitschia caucasica TaxID=637954 RepID=A0AAV2LXC5_KNICA